jgi:hypothetical protein
LAKSLGKIRGFRSEKDFDDFGMFIAIEEAESKAVRPST